MIDDVAFDAIAKASKALEDRRPGYKHAQDYYDGRHNLPFATERWLNVYGEIFQQLRDNLCELVVEALCSRLKVDGFGVEASGEDVSRVLPGERPPEREPDADARLGQRGRQIAADLWSHNRMDAQQKDVHREAAIKGDAYVIVWPEPETGRAGIYVQDAECCYVEYDPERPTERLWAAKRWTEGEGEDARIRITLYYPDRIEKYISARKDEPKDPSGWEPYMLGELVTDPETGEQVWLGEPWPLGNPYGKVPVFHFRNKGKQGHPGVSELRNIIPVQDALNKSIMDLMVTAETHGLPQRYLLGLAPEIDEQTGDPKPLNFKVGKDQFWAAWGDQIRMGEFAAAELAGLLGLVNDLRAECGRLSFTPPHLLFMTTGEIPSGEALKVVEAPFTAKVDDSQTVLGNSWEDVEGFAVLVDTGSDVDVRLSVEWADRQPVSEVERVARAEGLKRLGLPDRYIWRRVLGLSDVECDELERMKAKQLDEEARRAAERGNAPIVGPDGQPVPGETPPALAASAAAASHAAAGGAR